MTAVDEPTAATVCREGATTVAVSPEGSATVTVSPEGSTTVTVCPDGPLLVRGPFTLRTADGTLVDSSRSVLALCRCGRSRLKPLCDGSHKAARFRDDASAGDLRHVLETATPPPRTGTD